MRTGCAADRVDLPSRPTAQLVLSRLWPGSGLYTLAQRRLRRFLRISLTAVYRGRWHALRSGRRECMTHAAVLGLCEYVFSQMANSFFHCKTTFKMFRAIAITPLPIVYGQIIMYYAYSINIINNNNGMRVYSRAKIFLLKCVIWNDLR